MSGELYLEIKSFHNVGFYELIGVIIFVRALEHVAIKDILDFAPVHAVIVFFIFASPVVFVF